MTTRGSKTQRTGDRSRWQLRASIPTTDGGRRQLSKTVTAPTAAEADRLLNKWLLELGQVDPEAYGTTVLELVNLHLAQAKKLAPAYLEDCHRVTRLHLPAWLSGKVATTVTARDLYRLYDELEAADVSANRVIRLHTVLSRAYQRGIRQGYVESNPCRDAEPPTRGKRVTKTRPPTVAEIDLLVAAAYRLEWRKRSADDVATAVRLDVETGMRRGELVALRWGDIDLTTGRLVVGRALAYAAATGVIEKGTKTGKVRTLALDSETVRTLAKHRARRAEVALSLGVAIDDESFVFGEPTGREPWRPDVLTEAFIRIREEAGIEGVRFGDVRHFQATQLMAAGVNPVTIAGRMGNTVQTMENVYAHELPAHDQTAAQVIADLFRKEA